MSYVVNHTTAQTALILAQAIGTIGATRHYGTIALLEDRLKDLLSPPGPVCSEAGAPEPEDVSSPKDPGPQVGVSGPRIGDEYALLQFANAISPEHELCVGHAIDLAKILLNGQDKLSEGYLKLVKDKLSAAGFALQPV